MMTRLTALLLAVACTAWAATNQNPFGARDAALQDVGAKGFKRARSLIAQVARTASSAYDLCYAAELMKLVGDYRAQEYYEKAIRTDGDEPAYELFYGEYLRNFRGSIGPLFPKAEDHFFAAERKLRRATAAAVPPPCWHKDVREQLARALVALYQRDGLPLTSWVSGLGDGGERIDRPSLFLSTGVVGAQSTADLDRTSDIRDLTAGAMLAQARHGSPVGRDFLRANIRTVAPLESLNRVRFRYRGAPTVDVFFNGRYSDNAQITHYTFEDGQSRVPYNRVELTDYGVSLGRPFTIFNRADAEVGVTLRRVRRWGVVEFNPGDREDINQVEVRGAVSRFVGPDKVNLEFTFVNQDIARHVLGSLSRDRQIYAGTFTYQLFRLANGYGRRFEGTRGIDLSFGAQHDQEDYPDQTSVTAVVRRDYFVGVTVRAVRRFDFSIQPTWFLSDVSTDRLQYNSQYRTAAYVLYRVVDEERTGGLSKEWLGMRLAFLNVAVPFHHDAAQTGLNSFENYKVGIEVAAKWFTTVRRGVTFLGSVRYDWQRFYVLNRNLSLVSGHVTMGF